MGATRCLPGHLGRAHGALLNLRSSTDLYNIGYNNPGGAAMKLKITSIGNSAGVILPRELLAKLRLDKGDELYAVETPDGIRLTTYDPVFAAQMEVAERIMREDRDLLRRLAE